MNELNLQDLSFFHKILVIDIETVSIVSQYDNLNDLLKKQWSHKSATLRKYNPELGADHEVFEQKAGIYAEFAKIVCISVGKFVPEDGQLSLKVKSYSGDDEQALLHSFFWDMALFEKKHAVIFCGHNIKEFDLPFICRRSLVHGLRLPACLQLGGMKPWNHPHIDTLELWRFGDYKHYVSLDLLAAIFDIGSSKEEMDGSMVSEAYWNKDNLPGIVKYCNLDVATTAKVFLKMKGAHTDLKVNFLP